jgi:uncharacterized integral membrane protein
MEPSLFSQPFLTSGGCDQASACPAAYWQLCIYFIIFIILLLFIYFNVYYFKPTLNMLFMIIFP